MTTFCSPKWVVDKGHIDYAYKLSPWGFWPQPSHYCWCWWPQRPRCICPSRVSVPAGNPPGYCRWYTDSHASQIENLHQKATSPAQNANTRLLWESRGLRHSQPSVKMTKPIISPVSWGLTDVSTEGRSQRRHFKQWSAVWKHS